jgi:hypothetical protein
MARRSVSSLLAVCIFTIGLCWAAERPSVALSVPPRQSQTTVDYAAELRGLTSLTTADVSDAELAEILQQGGGLEYKRFVDLARYGRQALSSDPAAPQSRRCCSLP